MEPVNRAAPADDGDHGRQEHPLSPQFPQRSPSAALNLHDAMTHNKQLRRRRNDYLYKRESVFIIGIVVFLLLCCVASTIYLFLLGQQQQSQSHHHDFGDRGQSQWDHGWSGDAHGKVSAGCV